MRAVRATVVVLRAGRARERLPERQGLPGGPVRARRAGEEHEQRHRCHAEAERNRPAPGPAGSQSARSEPLQLDQEATPHEGLLTGPKTRPAPERREWPLRPGLHRAGKPRMHKAMSLPASACRHCPPPVPQRRAQPARSCLSLREALSNPDGQTPAWPPAPSWTLRLGVSGGSPLGCRNRGGEALQGSVRRHRHTRPAEVEPDLGDLIRF